MTLQDPLLISLREAERQFARLDGALALFPSHESLSRILAYIEAVDSLRCSDLVIDLASCLDSSDKSSASSETPVSLGKSYAQALAYPVGHRSKQAFGISLIKQIHHQLFAESPRESSSLDPVFRPDDERIIAMGALETYLNQTAAGYPPLVDAALFAYQMEAIAPLPQNNELVTRLLSHLLFRWHGLLKAPCLLYSGCVHRRRYEVQDRLRFVREQGDYLQWVGFYIDLCTEAARTTVDWLQNVIRTQTDQRRLIYTKQIASPLAYPFLSLLLEHPVFTISDLANTFNTSFQRTSMLVDQFLKAGIIEECTGKKRGKRYIYPALLRR